MRSLALRIYRDIVRRRTTVRIHQAEWGDSSIEPPAFLLGLYRSGTTPIRYSLAMHPSIAAPPESDFLVSFLNAIRDDRSISGLSTLGFDRDHVVSAYRQASTYFFSNYAESISSQVRTVVDKTPSYVAFAPELVELFPSSKFMVLTRHPLGQIGSATRYGRLRPEIPDFPKQTNASLLVDAANYWAERTSVLLSFREAQLQKSILFRYEDLCIDSEAILRNTLQFLDLPWDDGVMRYNGDSADRGREGAKALAHNGFEASLADPTRGWESAAEALETVWPIVGPVARELGYTRDGFG